LNVSRADPRVAVVTGGLGDIGRATALELRRRGCRVAVSDLDPAPAAPPDGVERYDKVDVRDADAVGQWFEALRAEMGVPTVVVSNAGIATNASLRDMTGQQWHDDIDVNLHGSFNVCTAAARLMAGAGVPGRIVLVGSWAGHTPHRHVPAYSVAKAGLRMLTKLLALEFARDGILVNEVAPGFVDAGLSGRAFDADPAMRAAATAMVPTHALINAADVAREIGHLCDLATTHLTGSTVLMDGGLSLVGIPRLGPDTDD
jgi:NAD(P)-dependent dehydrogenase (short-subunit alcohol dehydrogenase family)